MSQSGSSNAVEIVLQAADRASGTVASVADSVDNLRQGLQALNQQSGDVADLSVGFDAVVTRVDALREAVAGLGESLSRTSLSINVDESQALAGLEEAFAQGLVGEQEFQARRLAIVRQGNEERLNATTEALEQLQAEAAALSQEELESAQDIQGRILQLESQAAQQRIQVARSILSERRQVAAESEAIERQRIAAEEALRREISTGAGDEAARASAAAKAAETEAQIEIQQLRNQGAISAEEINQRIAASAQRRINAELAAERQRLEALRSIQGGNESEIRQVQQRILDLTKAGLEEEQRLQEANAAVVEQQSQRKFRAIVGITFAFNQIGEAISTLRDTFSGAFDLFIGQNVRLQEQLLATQASLVATNRIFSGGIEITDPTAAIQAVEGSVTRALDQIRQDSLQLTGVTSAQLVPVFQVIAADASAIGASLDDAADLTIDFAAALGTLGVPLDQANTQVQGILQGQIDSSNVVARATGLNNELVRQYTAQGTLVEEISKRLEAFRAGNALAAQTLGGVTSNIREVIDESARLAGESLLEPLVAQLSTVLEFLQSNQDQIQNITQQVTGFILGVGERIGAIVEAVQPAIARLAAALGNLVGQSTGRAEGLFLGLADAVVLLVQAIAPLLTLVANLILGLSELAGNPLVQTATAVAALTAGIIAARVAIIAFSQSTAAATLSSLTFSKVLTLLRGKAIAGLITGLGQSTVALNAFAAASAKLGLTGISAGFTQIAVSLKGLVVGLKAGTVSIAAFGTALKGIAVGAAAVAGPILAVGAAIAAVALSIQAFRLADANASLESFTEQLDVVQDQAFNTAFALKALSEAEEENGQLTEEQAKRKDALIQKSQQEIEELERLRDAIAAQKPVNEAQRQAQENQLQQIETTINALSKYGNEVEIVGSRVDALAKRLEVLNAELDRTNLEVDTDQSKGLADLEDQLNQGLISEQEFQQQRTALTRSGDQERLDATNEALAELKDAIADFSEEELAAAQDIQDEILKLEGQSAQLRGAIARSSFEERKALAEQEEAEAKRRADESRQEIDDAASKALDATKKAETERQIEIQKLRNQGAISAAQANQLIAESNQKRIEGELAAEKERLKELEALGGDNEKEIRASQQRILDLTKAGLDEEQRLQEAATRLFREEIEKRAQAVLNGIEQQNQALIAQEQLYEAVQRSLETQNRLLDAGRDLISAQANAQTAGLDILGRFETSDRRRRELAQQKAIIELESLREQQALERELFEIQQQQNRLALERREIENQIAQVRIQAEIAQGQADLQLAQRQLQQGEISPEQFQAQQLQQQARLLQLQGAQQESALIDRERNALAVTERFERQRLETQQRAAETQGRAALVETAAPGDRRRLERQLQEDILGSSTQDFLQNQRRGNQQFIQDEFFGGGGQGALDRLDPGRTRPEEVIAQAGQFASELAPQFAGLQGGVEQFSGLQGQGNDLLREISSGIQQLGGQANAAQAPVAAGGQTFNIDVQVNAGGQPADVANATGQAIEQKLRNVFRATAQLAAQG